MVPPEPIKVFMLASRPSAPRGAVVTVPAGQANRWIKQGFAVLADDETKPSIAGEPVLPDVAVTLRRTIPLDGTMADIGTTHTVTAGHARALIRAGHAEPVRVEPQKRGRKRGS